MVASSTYGRAVTKETHRKAEICHFALEEFVLFNKAIKRGQKKGAITLESLR